MRIKTIQGGYDIDGTFARAFSYHVDRIDIYYGGYKRTFYYNGFYNNGMSGRNIVPEIIQDGTYRVRNGVLLNNYDIKQHEKKINPTTSTKLQPVC